MKRLDWCGFDKKGLGNLMSIIGTYELASSVILQILPQDLPGNLRSSPFLVGGGGELSPHASHYTKLTLFAVIPSL